jgi:hypothetical protein
VPWEDRKPQILREFTTDRRMAVTANFLDEGGGGDDGNGQAAGVKKVTQMRVRLEELEEEAESNSRAKRSYLSQKEYIAHMEKQHVRLREAWAAGERVLALKSRWCDCSCDVHLCVFFCVAPYVMRVLL